MRNNLIFNGTKKQTNDDNTEEVLHQCIQVKKMKHENKFQFDRVRRLCKNTTNPNRLRPIVAICERHKDPETVSGSSKGMKETRFGVNEQFPRQVIE